MTCWWMPRWKKPRDRRMTLLAESLLNPVSTFSPVAHRSVAKIPPPRLLRERLSPLVTSLQSHLAVGADGSRDQLQLVGEEDLWPILQKLGFWRADARRSVVVLKQILKNAPQHPLDADGRIQALFHKPTRQRMAMFHRPLAFWLWLHVEHQATNKFTVLTFIMRHTAAQDYLSSLNSNRVTGTRMSLRSSSRSPMTVIISRKNTVCANHCWAFTL